MNDRTSLRSRSELSTKRSGGAGVGAVQDGVAGAGDLLGAVYRAGVLARAARQASSASSASLAAQIARLSASSPVIATS
jgi:hypothetical protein